MISPRRPWARATPVLTIELLSAAPPARRSFRRVSVRLGMCGIVATTTAGVKDGASAWPRHALPIPEYNLDRDRRRFYGPSAPRGGRRLCPRRLARGLGPRARWRRAGDGPEPTEHRARRDLARGVRGHAASVARARRGDSDRRHRVLHHGALSDVRGRHEARGDRAPCPGDTARHPRP